LPAIHAALFGIVLVLVVVLVLGALGFRDRKETDVLQLISLMTFSGTGNWRSTSNALWTLSLFFENPKLELRNSFVTGSRR
jgi:hypothetical protein